MLNPKNTIATYQNSRGGVLINSDWGGALAPPPYASVFLWKNLIATSQHSLLHASTVCDIFVYYTDLECYNSKYPFTPVLHLKIAINASTSKVTLAAEYF